MAKNHKKSARKDNRNLIFYAAAAIILIVVVVLLARPAPEAPPEVPEELQEPETPVREAPQEGPPEEEGVIEEIEETLRTPNEQITSLYSRSDQVKSLSFTAVRIFTKDGALQGDTIGIYEIHGEKARVEPPGLISMGGWSADFVFVDFAAGTAEAHCLELPGCRDEPRVGLVPYARYGIPLPAEWQDEISYGELAGSLQYNDRPTRVVRWEDGGLYWEAYLDQYYGYPMRVVSARDAQRTDIAEGWEYRSIAFNGVRQERVEPN